MKTIVFAYSLSTCKAPGKYIALSGSQATIDKNLEQIELTTLYNRFGEQWFDQFSEWLGQLNCYHADLLWWAHTATAKNLLSSSLGQHYFQVRAICEISKQEEGDRLYVLGATVGQMTSIASLLPKDKFQVTGRAWQLRHLNKLANNIKALIKICFQIGTVVEGFFSYRFSKPTTSPKLCLFTYMDGVRREGIDNYFGKLPELLRENDKSFSIFYLAYVYRPYRRRLKQLLKEGGETPYIALYGFLRIKDYVWVIHHSLREWWFNAGPKKKLYQMANDYIAILREVFVNEIAGYFHHLLVYKATCRFMEKYSPKVIAYPYENKSLEKMILLGLNRSKHSSQHRVKIVGYQHTSVTPRHSTLFFRPGEAAYTPLPDKIITVGKITKDYLEKFGNYPSGILTIGGALRQIWSERLPQQNTKNLRVLLALSSSKDELIQSIKFFKEVMKYIPNLELGIRPHINFPFSLLPDALTIWMRGNVLDLSNTLLQDNLNWCNLTAYVSSTVALESLMRGKPAVNFSIGDIVSPDPLIGEVPFHWAVSTPIEMADVLMEIHQMSMSYYEQGSLKAVTYVSNYLLPINDLSLKDFILT